MGFSQNQLRVLALLPRITGPLSMIGSLCVIRSVACDMIDSVVSPYQRLLFSFSCMDFLTSFWMAWSTYPIPAGTPGVWAAGGNTALCNAQGFWIQAIVACPLYNAAICIYFLLTTRYRWSDEKIQKIEPLLHGIPLVYGFGTAGAGLVLELYNNAKIWCWIAPFPPGCKDSATYGQDANCVRGDNAMSYRWPFLYGPVWVSIIVAMVCMLLIYCSVLNQERDVDKYQHDGVMRRTRSKRVAWQALWYLLAFYLSWGSASVNRVIQAVTGGTVYYSVTFLHCFLTPFQGFLNFLVYFRGRYLKYRREHHNRTPAEALKNALFARNREAFGLGETSATPGSTTNSSVIFSNLAPALAVTTRSKGASEENRLDEKSFEDAPQENTFKD